MSKSKPSHSDVAAEIRRHEYHYSGEADLQAGLWVVLSPIPGAAREVRLGSRDRIDFLVGRVGVEVKVGGTLAEVVRQLLRYAERDEIDSLVLVTTQQRHRGAPRELNGKPVLVIWMGSTF